MALNEQGSLGTIGHTVLWLYVSLYLVGVLAGLAASIYLDVQMHRPGIRQAIGLVFFVFLLWGALSVTHTPFSQVLLPLVWAGTGILAGLGSRGPQGAV